MIRLKTCCLFCLLGVCFLCLVALFPQLFPHYFMIVCHELDGLDVNFVCQRRFPKFFYRGSISNSQRSGFGVESTDEYEYRGKFELDRKNGDGKMKFYPSSIFPFEGLMTGYWSDDHLRYDNGSKLIHFFSDKGEYVLFFNSTTKLVYRGQVDNTLLSGGGSIGGYQITGGGKDQLHFELSNGHFVSGKLSVHPSQKTTDLPRLKIWFQENIPPVELTVVKFVDEWSYQRGYECDAILEQEFGPANPENDEEEVGYLKSETIQYGWNGKNLRLLNQPENSDFVIYMVERKLSEALVFLREFELYFLLQNLVVKKQQQFSFSENTVTMVMTKGEKTPKEEEEPVDAFGDEKLIEL